MRCHEAEGLLAPQLSDCLDAATQRELALHLDACAACRARLQQEYEIDRMVVAAVNRGTPPVGDLATRIEQRLKAKPFLRPSFLGRRWPAFAGAAAVVLLCALALVRFSASNSMHLLCLDAVDDHQTEVVKQEPRRWATGSEVAELARRTVPRAQVPQAIAGLPLEKARICGLLEATALHLVYGSGPKQVSVFLMLRQELPSHSLPAQSLLARRLHQETDSGLTVASFADSGLGIVVVGNADLTRNVADQLVRVL